MKGEEILWIMGNRDGSRIHPKQKQRCKLAGEERELAVGKGSWGMARGEENERAQSLMTCTEGLQFSPCFVR